MLCYLSHYKIDFTTAVVGGTGGVEPGVAVGTVIKVGKSVDVTSNMALLNTLAKEKGLLLRL